jgi:hypothetical protein
MSDFPGEASGSRKIITVVALQLLIADLDDKLY